MTSNMLDQVVLACPTTALTCEYLSRATPIVCQ